MPFKNPDSNYWNEKFAAYLHDPFDKVFRIQGHESRAGSLLGLFGLEKPLDEFWKIADSIAAGFERGQIPSYSANENKNGAIDFINDPCLTHPTADRAHLHIQLPDGCDIETVHKKLLESLKENIGMKPGDGGYSDSFKGDEARFAQARVIYTHLALRTALANNNVANLGALWHRIPADSRFPDHSIWQHTGLTSAIYSCMKLAGNSQSVGMMVVNLSPVQGFIGKARKLRDYWTGSTLLSWLAFEGLRWVMENLGPDHILYPSPINQPLVNKYLDEEWKIKCLDRGHCDVASLPNKIIFLIPLPQANDIAAAITAHIRAAWTKLADNIKNLLVGKLNLDQQQKNHVATLFETQNNNFWDIQWVATKLLEKSDESFFKEVLPNCSYDNQINLLRVFGNIEKEKKYYSQGQGILYSTSHTLLQSALAASKAAKKISKNPEGGEKCHLCGEYQILHDTPHKEGEPAKPYDEKAEKFWRNIQNTFNNDRYDLNDVEKLCSVCFIKRFAYRIKEDKEHFLSKVFDSPNSFPMTTEIALHDYFELNNVPKEERKNYANEFHDKDEQHKISAGDSLIRKYKEKPKDHDCYYAILLMDGDKMGSLINGETLAAKWANIMHPELARRLNQTTFDPLYQKNWNAIFTKHNQRLITPAIHAAISEALGNFSVYSVYNIIKKNHGCLVYAGGDDVCAVLPVSKALKAAKEIKNHYVAHFNLIDPKTGNIEHIDLDKKWTPRPGLLTTGMGQGDNISISAGILICHYMENLSHMIERAHHLLDDHAKNKCGRNACAIELKKRSGGSRYFAGKWDKNFTAFGQQQDLWESFNQVINYTKKNNEQELSTSLIYRLEKFRNGMTALIKIGHYGNMVKFLEQQLERSQTGSNVNTTEVAKHILPVILRPSQDINDKLEFEPEGLIVASFLAKRGAHD
ncbi:MAG: hypothetical protein ACD_62C00269G0002 [uncultured bacterium]|nr:MAG: hypothetical protein ACD_62C00269G0002 [uncultured bacterium]